jgi:hypothetical protein
VSKPVQAIDNDDNDEDDIELMSDGENKENQAASKSSMETVIDAETGEVGSEQMDDVKARLGEEAMETSEDTQTKEAKACDSELSDYTSVSTGFVLLLILRGAAWSSSQASDT